MGLRIELLGDLRVVAEGVSPPTRGSHLRLLSILALEDRRVGTERLIDMFWGESPPESAKAALQTHVSALRRILGADAIVTEGYGYRLNVKDEDLDVSQFVEAVRRAREAADGGDWDEALRSSSAGLGMWRGQPYAELVDDEFARAEIVRLEELHLDLWDIWAESQLRLGRESEALPELERLVVEHPLRERLWEHLMRARYRLGRHAEALRAFQEVSEILAEIGLEPGQALRHLEDKILTEDEEVTSTRHNLPAELTTFIGREEELRLVEKLLDAHRVVTLTGVGGSGKTRLALTAAMHKLDDFPDGCWLVNLADLRDPALIPIEVAAAIGLRPRTEDPLEDLSHSLRRDTMLLVLDNCEHLREGAANVVRALVTAGDGVTVLATSREPLHLPGEALFDVPPLDIPPETGAEPDLCVYDSVRLFQDRAMLADPQFELDGNRDMVAAVCRRLDGIPLAIELVASKVRTLGLELIDEHLGDRLLSLAVSQTTDVPRHQTLEAAISWSYDLLDDTERRLFERLAVFRGGFDVAMVQHVAEYEPRPPRSPLDDLESLVAKSLVTRERTEAGRFSLLETVREFAHRQLVESGQLETVRRLHLQWCLDFASMIESRVYGAGRLELQARLRLERDNLLAGLETARARSDDKAISLIASTLAWHWGLNGNMTGAAAALDLALTHWREQPVRKAEMQIRLAHNLFGLNQGQRALDEAVSATELVETLGHSVQKVAVLCKLANLRCLLVDQDPREALSLAREAVRVADASGDPMARVRANVTLGQVLAFNGEVDDALSVALQARDDAVRSGDPWAAISAYSSLFDIVNLHPVERRELPRRLVGEIEIQFPVERWQEYSGLQLGWFPYIYMQTGEWEKAERINRIVREGRMEGYDHIWYLMTHGTLCWMRGDVEETSRAMDQVDEIGVNPRWYHDYYPLRADVAADTGDLAATRVYARAYLSAVVDPSEEANKLGVLNPLVRAEVNAALSTHGRERDVHVAEAEALVKRMEEILGEFPPLSQGSLALETHGTHLALARAELSRVTGPDPSLWHRAMERADYIYFRLYARIRLAEALALSGDLETALVEWKSAHADSQGIGARGLLGLLGGLDMNAIRS